MLLTASSTVSDAALQNDCISSDVGGRVIHNAKIASSVTTVTLRRAGRGINLLCRKLLEVRDDLGKLGEDLVDAGGEEAGLEPVEAFAGPEGDDDFEVGAAVLQEAREEGGVARGVRRHGGDADHAAGAFADLLEILQ